MPTKHPDSIDGMRAQRIAKAAIAKAKTKLADTTIASRSTRSRAAFKIKAEALDRVERILSGKE